MTGTGWQVSAGAVDLPAAFAPGDEFTVKGDPEAIRTAAFGLSDRSASYDAVAAGLRDLTSPNGWWGRAAERFHERFAPEPDRWRAAADGFWAGAAALQRYADALERAQVDAATARARFADAERATQSARAAHEADVKAGQAEKAAWEATNGPGTFTLTIEPFADPGEAGRVAARAQMADVRTGLAAAAGALAEDLGRASTAAPEQQRWWQTALNGGKELVVGAAEATWSMSKFGNPVWWADVLGQDLMKLSAGELTAQELATKMQLPIETAGATLAALAVARATNPLKFHVDMTKALLEWDLWGRNPGRALGHLVPDIVIAAATAGTGTAATRGASAVRSLMGLKNVEQVTGSVPRLASVAEGAALRAEANPSEAARLLDDIPEHIDPVDVATGIVVLTETDVTVAGELPVHLARRYSSGYAGGLSFGPNVATVLDERVEVEPERVSWVSAEGAVVIFPAPIPGGLPVLAQAGSVPWELRDEVDGYTLVDPVSRLRRVFARAAEPSPAGARDVETVWLSRMQDRAGRVVELERDGEGLARSVLAPSGTRVVVVRAGTQVTGLAVDDGERAMAVVVFAYDEEGHLVTVSNGAGDLAFEYNDAGLLSAWVDRNGMRFDYRYDGLGRCVWQGAPDGAMRHSLSYEQDDVSGQRVTVITDPMGGVERYVVDGTGRLVALVDAVGAVTQWVRDARGRVVELVDPVGGRQAWAFDDRGRVVSYVDASGAAWRVAFAEGADGGEVVTVVAPDGAVTRSVVDGRGLLVGQVDAGGGETAYRYDQAGGLAGVRDAAGREFVVECDAAGLPVTWREPLGGVTRWVRDAWGRVVAQSDPLGAVTRWEWSVSGRLLSVTDPAGAREWWSYDGEGNVVLHQDPLGRVTRREYGPFDKLAREVLPDGSVRSWTRDALLRVTGLTDPMGREWTFERNAAGRVVREHDVNGSVTVRDFDAAGRVVVERDGVGGVRRLDYDAVGRCVRVSAAAEEVSSTGDGKPAEQVRTFAFDAVGRLVRAQGEVALERGYDAAGRLVSETVDGLVSSWEYDPTGRPVREVNGFGVVTTFGYDAAGREVQRVIDGHVVDTGRDAAGRVISREGAGGRVETVYDLVGRLAGVTVVGTGLPGGAGAGAAQWSMKWGYDAAGDVVERVATGGQRTRYGLDDRRRVTSVTHQAPSTDPAQEDRLWEESYRYDPADVLVASGIAATDVAGGADGGGADVGPTARGREFRAGSGLPVRVGREVLSWDAAGRLVARSRRTLSGGRHSTSYGWNGFGELAQVEVDGQVWRLRYDPLGRVVERVDSATGVGVRFGWDAARRVAGWDAPEVGLTMVSYAGWSPVATLTRPSGPAPGDPTRGASMITLEVRDVTSLPIARLAQGAVQAAQPRTLYGAPGTAGSGGDAAGAGGLGLLYAGQVYDPVIGLAVNGFRMYDPGLGLYLSPDPIGAAASWNPTGYVANPTTHIDPLGLVPCPPEGADAANTADDIGGVIYRTGSRTDNALTDGSGVSFRDSVSSSLSSEHPQVFRPGDKVWGVDTSLLPKGSIVRDGVPPGHVSVRATPEQIRAAIVNDPFLSDLGLKPLDEFGAFRLPK